MSGDYNPGRAEFAAVEGCGGKIATYTPKMLCPGLWRVWGSKEQCYIGGSFPNRALAERAIETRRFT